HARLPCFCTHVPSSFRHPTAPTEPYTLSLHDALPIYVVGRDQHGDAGRLHELHQGVEDVIGRAGVEIARRLVGQQRARGDEPTRSEEHTSELQSLAYLVCRLLLEKKKKK